MQNKEQEHTQLIEYLKCKYDSIRLIVSPPRSASTALARLFWEHPDIRYYAHEPFEVTYYQNKSILDALHLIDQPIDLSEQYKKGTTQNREGLVIKEMPYQVGKNFPILASLTKFPIIFLLRDPRLNIYSRIQKKIEGGSSPIFPLQETGWELMLEQINFCEQQNIPFSLVKADDYRSDPNNFTMQLMDKMGLQFFPELLNWRPAETINLDNLAGPHSHLYLKVLASTGVLPPTEDIPCIDDFPTDGGIRDHVYQALEIYKYLLNRPELLQI